jgi:hypothetical protein
MTGTGLKKCKPRKRSERAVLLAISPMGMEEVLLAKIVEGLAIWKRGMISVGVRVYRRLWSRGFAGDFWECSWEI